MNNMHEVELLGNGWVQIVDCKYVQRSDDNTRKVTIRISEISEIVSHEPRLHCNDMCKIVMSNGDEYNACCNYDVLVELLCCPLKEEDTPIEEEK